MGKHASLKARNLDHRQKFAVRVINFKDRFFHAKPLLTEINILSVYYYYYDYYYYYYYYYYYCFFNLAFCTGRSYTDF